MSLGCLATLCLLSACASGSGGPPTAGGVSDPAKVAAIRPGATTEADLVRDFGPPAARGLDRQGRPLLVWRYLQATANGRAYIPVAGPFLKSSDVRQQELKVALDARGRVADHRLTEENREANVFGR